MKVEPTDYNELKRDVHEIKNQLNQIVELLQILVDKKNENENKYIIQRKNRNEEEEENNDMEDIVTNHTIIKKEVLKDLETKGFSEVKRYENEEETKPINDPIHVRILYNFGFVLDINHDKFNAILLLSTVLNYNLIHINVVRKLNLVIKKVNQPFVVRSALSKYQSNEFVTLTLAVNMNKDTNKMFTSDFVVSYDDHHNDMIVVNFSTLAQNQVSEYSEYEFDELEDIAFIL